jgi:hypothetical protein
MKESRAARSFVSPENHNPKRLTSWKEIADFLGITERTAQTWEKERGLPVHRQSGAHGHVFALSEELEQWRKKAVAHLCWYDNASILRLYAALGTVFSLILIGVLVGIFVSRNHKGLPAMFHLDYKTLIVTDASGRELWRKSFEDTFEYARYTGVNAAAIPHIWFGHLDNAQKVDTLFIYYPTNREKNGTALYCFSQKGEEKWRFVPGRIVSDGGGSHSSAYIVANFVVSTLGQQGRGRDARHRAPPAQIRTGATNAYGSYLG